MAARCSLGGKADGTFFPPTVLTEVPVTAQVCSNEAFAPLVVAFPFKDLDDAVRQVNNSFFGLQTGVFTNDLAGAWRAFNDLEVGGVIVNDVRRTGSTTCPMAASRTRVRARRTALGDGGHDRDPDHGARPTAVGAAPERPGTETAAADGRSAHG